MEPQRNCPIRSFPLLPGSCLIGISHFPDPGGLGLECDSPALSLLITPSYSSYPQLAETIIFYEGKFLKILLRGL